MKIQVSRLNRLILEAALADYTPFESITSHVLSELRSGSDEFDDDSIEDALLALVSDGLVEACLLHAEPPFVTAVHPARSTLQQFWFCITKQGEERLASWR